MRRFDDLLHAAGELTDGEREHIVRELIAGDPYRQTEGGPCWNR